MTDPDVSRNGGNQRLATLREPRRSTSSRFCCKALFGILWPHAGSHAASELFSTHLSGCKPQNDPLLLINSGIEFVTVQDQEHFHCKMANALVAIDERMIADQRKTQGGGFSRQAWIQILPIERHLRLSNSRLKAAKIAHAFKPASLPEHEAMKLQDLLERQIPNHASRR
jgi:hypothetical protein